jgi:hypothetical protein
MRSRLRNVALCFTLAPHLPRLRYEPMFPCRKYQTIHRRYSKFFGYA